MSREKPSKELEEIRRARRIAARGGGNGGNEQVAAEEDPEGRRPVGSLLASLSMLISHVRTYYYVFMKGHVMGR